MSAHSPRRTAPAPTGVLSSRGPLRALRRPLALLLGTTLVSTLLAGTGAAVASAATVVEPPVLHAFTFDGTDSAVVAGASPLLDSAGAPLGFTSVQPYGPRPAGEAPRTTSPDQPALRTVAGGNLTITATPGIQFRTTTAATNSAVGTGDYNLLDNGLGVPAPGNDGTFVLETTLVNPAIDAAGGSKQAGLWLGRGQDDLVKLVLVDGAGDRGVDFQLQREIAGVVDSTNGVHQIASTAPAALPAGATVGLKLTVDADAQRVSGQYRINGGAWTAVVSGSATSLAFDRAALLDDPATTAAVEAAAGVFATRRTDTTAGKTVAYSFADFTLRSGDATAPAAPTGIRAVAGADSVALSWNGPADAAAYLVRRSAEATGEGDVIATVTGRTHTDSTVVAGTTYRYSVVARDAAGNASDPSGVATATPAGPAAEGCAPWSVLDCADVPVAIPARLGFDGMQGGLGTGAGGTGPGSGFTVVQPSGAPAASVPADVAVTDGELRITAGQGINFSAVNTQANALGVGIDPTAPFRLETTVVAPYTDATSGAEQSGLWVGLGQDDYAKLVVINNVPGRVKLQLAREESGVTYAAARDEVSVTPGTNGLDATQPIRLVLQADPATGVLKGSYAVGTGPLTALGTTLTVPRYVLDDSLVPAKVPAYTHVDGAATFAGVFATKRNEATATVVARFADFAVLDDVAPAATATPTATQAGARVAVSWPALGGPGAADLAGYRVQRAGATGDTVTATSDLLTTAGWEDTAVALGETHRYRVLAVDTSGNTPPASAWSEPVTLLAAPEQVAPGAPAGLTATAGATGVVLAWTAAPGEGSASYRVYRSADEQVSTAGTPLVTTATPGHTDTTAPAGATAHYAVVAVGGTGLVSAAATASAAVPPSEPGEPQVPTCTPGQWTAQWFDGGALAGAPAGTECLAAVDLTLGAGGPAAAPSVGTDDFSGRFTRTADYAAGTYAVTTQADDRVRVLVDGTVVVDRWAAAATAAATTQVPLTAGAHTVVVEYREVDGTASVRATIAAAGPPAPTCPVWRAEWFTGTELAGAPVATSCTTAVEYDFGTGAPVGTSLPVDGFSGRFTRTGTFSAGEYYLSVRADDGVRVVVDGDTVINSWRDQGAVSSGASLTLTEGVHTVVVEYYERTGRALLEASLSGPAFAACTSAATPWRAEHFAGRTLAGSPVTSRCEAVVDADYGLLAPAGVPVSADSFSSRYTRTLSVPTAGSYAFTARADDGVRVFVDDVAVIDSWTDSGLTTRTGTAVLAPGDHQVRVEHYEAGGAAQIRLSYERTGDLACGTGWAAEYFDGTTFTGTAKTVRCEASVDASWGTGRPPGTTVGPDGFSVRWTTAQTFTAGRYTFSTLTAANDGIRLLVDGEVQIDTVGRSGTRTSTAELDLTAGQHTVVVEYFEVSGSSRVKASWTGGAAPADPAPAAPTAVTGAPGNGTSGSVLTWTAPADTDVTGYRVFRGATMPVATTGTPLATVAGTTHTDTTAAAGSTWSYVVVAVDAAGQASAASAPVTVVTAAAPTPALDVRLNFQPAAAPVPTGYTAETGAAWTDAAGRGWVRQDSLASATHTPLAMTLNTRDRNRAGVAQELDTFIHAQYGDVTNASAANGTLVPGAFELAVPNGTYQVGFSVGDQPSTNTLNNPLCTTGAATCYDSAHTVRLEGLTALDQYRATALGEYRTGTATVTVADGRLTVDAVGGTNTKLNWLTVTGGGADTTPPAAPAALTGLPGDGSASLSWTASTSTDVVGYRVHRSTTLPVVTTGAPLATTTTPGFADSGLANGTTYHYAVVAVDGAGNASPASPSASVTPAEGTAVDLKVSFSNDAKVPPTGYLRDFGQPFGPRTAQHQGSGLSYGWVVQGTTTPLSLVGNGRDRTTGTGAVTPAEPRLGSMLHMQLPANATSGVTAPGSFELAVPEGVYEVAVSVGDPGTAVDSVHWLSIEDQNAVAMFVPTAGTRHAAATRTVAVDDGQLTISAAGGTNTKINYVTVRTSPLWDPATTPRVLNSTPANGATGVTRLGGAVASVAGPAGGIDGASMTAQTVRLQRLPDGADVAVTRTTSAGGDVVSVAPTAAAGLQPSTTYRFTVEGITDGAGTKALPWSSVFTTGTGTGGSGPVTDVAFTKQALPGTEGGAWTSVTFGPDGKLYASSVFGDIARWTVNADGTLGAKESITSVRDFHATDGTTNGRSGDMRTVIGLAFGPRPGANPGSEQVLWVSDNILFQGTRNVPEWDAPAKETSGVGYLTVPANPAQSVYRRVVENLPRSTGDHQTNSVVFHQGRLYIPVGANTSTGAPDSNWTRRSEKLLSASVLQLDVAALGTTQVIDAKTAEGGGSFNPFAPGSPLTIFATGNRNTYDLVSHSNGALYAPTNGSAANGNVPASTWSDTSSSANPRERDAAYPRAEHCLRGGPYTGPSVPLKVQLPDETDHLFTLKRGKYYGHPNPARCEFAFNGGNPTAGTDPFEYTGYAVGTQPDPDYDLAGTYDAGMHASANGAVEYRANAFGGALKGKLIYTRFSQTGDLVVVSPDPATKNITGARTIGLPGTTGYVGPLDITEDVRGDAGTGAGNGNLYVASMSQNDPFNSRITLLRPQGGAAGNLVAPVQEGVNDVNGGAAAPVPVVLRNTGSAALTIPAGGLSLTGPGAARFSTGTVALPATIPAGGSLTVPATFAANALGVVTATLTVASNDPDSPLTAVALRGLGTAGTGGTSEPSLQRVLDAHGLGIDVGDTDPATNILGSAQSYGQEVDLQRLVAAVDAPVTVTPLAVFGPTDVTPTVKVGWHTDGSVAAADRRELFTVPSSQGQSLRITPSGTTTFDPGTDVFGLYSSWPYFYGQHGQDYSVSTQDRLNTWDAATRHHVRAYPVPGQPDSYVLATEEHTSGSDYQDVVLLVTNVKAAAAPSNGAVLSVTNLDGVANSSLPVASRTAVPSPTRVVLSTLRTKDAEFTTTQRTHDTASVRVANTGTEPAQVTGLSTTAGFTVAPPTGTTLPATLAPGAAMDVTVTFTHTRTDAQRNQLVTGTLSVASTAGTGATKTLDLAGMYQRMSENGDEPDFQQVVTAFGWTTNTPPAALTAGVGGYQAVGDEVLSPFWRRVDATRPVTFTQLAALHGCCSTGSGDTLGTYTKGSATVTGRVTHGGLWGQSLLPGGTSGTSLAQGSFSPALTEAFGIRIGPEYSDPTRNNGALDRTNGCTAEVCGHHVRFFPVKDATGAVVPGSYVFGMDFSGINYDFQDNMYLVENVRPELGLAPARLAGAPGDRAAALTWAANTEPGVSGYQVFRSTTLPVATTGTPLATVTTPGYTDRAVTNGTTYHYVVRATYTAAVGGSTSPASAPVSVTPLSPSSFSARVDFTSPAAAPATGYLADFGQAYAARTGANQGTGLSYGWVAPGTGVPLNLSVGGTTPGNGRKRGVVPDVRVDSFMHMQGNLSQPQPFNGTAAEGAWEIAVPNGTYGVAVGVGDVQTNTNEAADRNTVVAEGVRIVNGFASTGATGSATRSSTGSGQVTVTDGRLTLTAGDGVNTKIQYVDVTASAPPVDTTAPAAVTGLTATASAAAVELDWADSSEPDLYGYTVARGTSAAGPFAPLTAEPVFASAYADTTAPAGTAVFYQVRAVDTADNASAPATASATRLAAPAAVTGLVATGSAASVVLDWADSPAGTTYRVERAPSAGGTYAVLTPTAITASTFTDTTIAAGATGFYRVFAVNAAGSSPAATASATRAAAPQTPSTVRINTGGAAQTVSGTTWSACTSVTACSGWVSGGTAYSEAGDTTTGVPAGMNNALFTSEWTGGTGAAGSRVFGFAVPVTNGDYTVRLHFAELNKFAAGARTFSVDVEGARKLTGFDVFAAAGGANRAVVREFPVTVTDGVVTIDFLKGVENAKVSAIEIVPGAGSVTPAPAAVAGLTATGSAASVVLDWADSPAGTTYRVERAPSETGTYAAVATGLTASTFTDTTVAAGATGFYRVFAVGAAGSSPAASASATRTAAPVRSTVRINTGGPAQTVSGTTWSACTSTTACNGWVSGGNPYAENGDTTTAIPAGMNNALFTSEWTGGAGAAGARVFGFAVPVANGSYTVRLHFAELNKFAAGARTFSVDVEGTRRLTGFDVYAAAGGANRAVVREFPVTVTDGVVTIDFLKGVENAKVSAIEIVPA